MGFDIQGFISKVEKFVNEGKADRQGKTGDGQFDAYEKASLFNNKELLSELKNACEEDLSVQQQVQNDLGLSLSSITSRIEELTTAKARRAGSGDGGDGGDGDGGDGSTGNGINIFVNNSVNINIQINISTEIKNEINNNLNCGCGGPGGADIDALVEILKKLLGEGGSIQEFILYIFNQFSEKLGLDLGNIQELLKQILSKLDSQEQTINKLNEYLVALMQQNYDALVMMGLKMDALIEIVKQGDEKNLEILGKIYTAIMDLTGQFQDFTEVEKKQFNMIMEMLNKGNVNLEQVLALLNAIKNDTSENNEISQNILDAIVNGNQKILEALTKIDTDFNKYGDEIKALLLKITNMTITGGGGDVTVNVDLTEVLDMLKAMLEKLNSIDNNTAENKELSKQILEAINKFGVEITSDLAKIIESIGNDSTKIDNLINFLKEMDESHKEQINKLLNAIANLTITGGGGGDVSITIDVDAIIDAINKAGGDVNAKMDEIIKLLTTINNNVVEGNENDKKLAADIIAAINKLGVDIAGSLTTIIENMKGDSEKLEKLFEFLKTMDENNKERVNKLLEAISKLTITGGGGGDVTISIDVDAIIDAINKAGGDMNAKMDEIIKMLNTINNNVVEGNEDAKKLAAQIIEAINALGVNVAGSLAVIIEKMDGDAAKMEELLAFLKTMDANNEERNKAILDAIAKVGVDVITALNNLDVKVTVEGGSGGGQTDLSAIIDVINANGADLSSKLSDIFTLLQTLNANVVEGNINNQTMAELILAAIANIGNISGGDGHTLDLEEVLAILRDILEAIKNHEVIITINSDGSVNCEGGTVNEGENNDWNNVLGARSRAASVTGITSATTEKEDNSPVFDLSGRKVSGPLKPGQVYIKNGKKFIAK